MSTIKTIKIDSTKKQVTIEDIENELKPLQDWVDGYIEPVRLPDGKNIVLVNEEGLLKNFTNGFYLKGHSQPYMGNGIIVGVNNRSGNFASTTLTKEQILTDLVWVGD